jgi:hypothetical protein
MFDDIKIIQVTMKAKDRSNGLKCWWDELREIHFHPAAQDKSDLNVPVQCI